jgi:hypothetical protein
MAVITAFDGPGYHFTTASDAMHDVNPSFASFDAAASEAGVSRIYGGIHYPFDNQAGLTLGPSVGTYVLHHAFKNVAPPKVAAV